MDDKNKKQTNGGDQLFSIGWIFTKQDLLYLINQSAADCNAGTLIKTKNIKLFK